jgi:hypothetical protein
MNKRYRNALARRKLGSGGRSAQSIYSPRYGVNGLWPGIDSRL